jgi:hypothetical protein
MLWPDGKSEKPANALKNLDTGFADFLLRMIFLTQRIDSVPEGSTAEHQIDCVVDIEQMVSTK